MQVRHQLTYSICFSVLLLLLAHLYFFTLFGMLLFPTPENPFEKLVNSCLFVVWGN